MFLVDLRIISVTLRRLMGLGVAPLQQEHMDIDEDIPQEPSNNSNALRPPVVKELERENKELKKELKLKTDKLAKITSEGREALERSISLEAQLRDERKEAARAIEERNNSNTCFMELKEEVDEWQARAHEAESHVAQLQNTLRAVESDMTNARALLDTRGAELRDAQAFMTQVDDVTDAEVLHIVNSINTLILQTAATITDMLPEYRIGETDISASNHARTWLQAADAIPPIIDRALGRVGHNVDPGLVQVTLQGAMTTYAHRLCSTWDFHTEGSRAQGLSLADIYNGIKAHGMIPSISPRELIVTPNSSEAPSVSGRWRTLTRTHLKTLLDPNGHTHQREAEARFMEYIVNVLLACSVQLDLQELRAQVKTKASESICDITQLALKFQRVTGAVIVSHDLQTTLVHPGTPFDSDTMVDEGRDARGKGRRKVQIRSPVLCTTQLGVRREEVVQNAERGGGRNGTNETLLLKPHVLLETMLEQLCKEQQEERDGSHREPVQAPKRQAPGF